VQEHEQKNFGEVSTDFSQPEEIVIMVMYIVGKEIIK